MGKQRYVVVLEELHGPSYNNGALVVPMYFTGYEHCGGEVPASAEHYKLFASWTTKVWSAYRYESRERAERVAFSLCIAAPTYVGTLSVMAVSRKGVLCGPVRAIQGTKKRRS